MEVEQEAVSGLEIPSEIRHELVVITVPHIAFNGSAQTGQLVIHRTLFEDVERIFGSLFNLGFPIHKIVPIAAYGWNDDLSMQDNNTSAFNYRQIAGTNLVSHHSYGRAIDINPMQNPYYARDGKVYPTHATYDPLVPGTLTKDGDAVRIFKKHGWEWLGDREENTDYQHFHKLG